MATTARFSGIFCPNIVPLDEQGNVHEAEVRRYVDWLIDRGVHGLYPNGSTGEFLRFTEEERRRINEIVIDQAAGRVPVLAGAAEANVKETLAACEHYAALGAAAVAIVSPFYYRLGPEAVYAYFSEIARSSPIDITLYNIPLFASPIEVETVERLAGEFERIVAIKDSSGDLPFMMKLIDTVRPSRPDFSFLTGWDPCLLPMLNVGCDGGTHASSGVAPELTRQLYDAAKDGDLDRAKSLQRRVTRLFDSCFAAAEFPEGFRMGVSLRGFAVGPARMPRSDRQLALDRAARQELALLFESEGLG